MNRQRNAWIERNKTALLAEYGDYRIRHDYSLGGTYFATFEAWADNEYRAWQLEQQSESA
jgi:hypothetical protein